MRPHDLARLIDEVKAGQDLSDEDIARTARRAGHQLSKQHVANLRAQDPLKSLVPKTLRALAAGLQLPLTRVVEASLHAAGLPSGAPEDWSVEAAITADAQLPSAAKRMLLRMVAEARADEHTEQGPTAPRPRNVTQLTRPVSAGKAARKRPIQRPENSR